MSLRKMASNASIEVTIVIYSRQTLAPLVISIVFQVHFFEYFVLLDETLVREQVRICVGSLHADDG